MKIIEFKETEKISEIMKIEHEKVKTAIQNAKEQVKKMKKLRIENLENALIQYEEKTITEEEFEDFAEAFIYNPNIDLAIKETCSMFKKIRTKQKQIYMQTKQKQLK